MPDFELDAPFAPTGDQPTAIDGLLAGLHQGHKHQTLLGATGTGKTFTIANIVQATQRPTLVMAHNKTLAAQLYAEFKRLFPNNAIEYFVSYYDYYQPEAYVPRHDLYIEKSTDINEQIERLRLSATASLFSRRDVLIVASVSCIYGIGDPVNWRKMSVELKVGDVVVRERVLRDLVRIQYHRNDLELRRGVFRVRGDTLEIVPGYSETAFRIYLWGDEIEKIIEFQPLTGEVVHKHQQVTIFPAREYITDDEHIREALQDIEKEMEEQLQHFKRRKNELADESIRLLSRADNFDNTSEAKDMEAKNLAADAKRHEKESQAAKKAAQSIDKRANPVEKKAKQLRKQEIQIREQSKRFAQQSRTLETQAAAFVHKIDNLCAESRAKEKSRKALMKRRLKLCLQRQSRFETADSSLIQSAKPHIANLSREIQKDHQLLRSLFNTIKALEATVENIQGKAQECRWQERKCNVQLTDICKAALAKEREAHPLRSAAQEQINRESKLRQRAKSARDRADTLYKESVADKEQANTLRAESDECSRESERQPIYANRLEQRTRYDIEMLREVGFTTGIENYSRHFDRRSPGSAPFTLIDYLPEDHLLVIDESHMTVPQIRGMYNGDRARKQILVDFGFRLPSALDNRPLQFNEFWERVGQTIYTSATPGPYEYKHSEQVVDQIIRATYIVDPHVDVRPIEGQIDDLLQEIALRVREGQRVLVNVLTQRMAEELAGYLNELGIKGQYLHAEVDTLERVEILRDLRMGVYDVIVGIGLLREGLDLPEVSLVAILDADKAGFSRSAQALIQMIGRAARHIEGKAILYADKMKTMRPALASLCIAKLNTAQASRILIVHCIPKLTKGMADAIDETSRRRLKQEMYNQENGIEPQQIVKDIQDITDRLRAIDGDGEDDDMAIDAGLAALPAEELEDMIDELEREMRKAADAMEFEKAAALRDQIFELRGALFQEQGLESDLMMT